MEHRVHCAVKALIVRGKRFLIFKQLVGEKFYWDLPGGRMQHGETPTQSLLREVQEETGLDASIEVIAGVWWFFREDGDQVVCLTYRCSAEGEIDLMGNPDEEERLEEARWVTKEEFLSEKYPVGHESLKELLAGLDFS